MAVLLLVIFGATLVVANAQAIRLATKGDGMPLALMTAVDFIVIAIGSLLLAFETLDRPFMG